MIPEIHPWHIYTTFKVKSTTYEFMNWETEEAFSLTFTALIPMLDHVTRDSVVFGFAPINLPFNPEASDYYEVLYVLH